MNDFINYYDLLDIKKDATKEEIKKAYREQAKKWHPDVNDSKEALDIIKELNEAKTILLEDEKRKEYDAYLEHAVNESYEKIRDKTKYSTEENKTYQNNKEKYEHDYTKWEYFIDYLKYYQTSNYRKALAVILVFIETVFCGILQLTNFLLALVLSLLLSIVSKLAYFLLGILIICSIVLFLSEKSFDITGFLLLLVICIVFACTPSLIAIVFFEKIPILLSKLNIFLFKLAVGYKNH